MSKFTPGPWEAKGPFIETMHNSMVAVTHNNLFTSVKWAADIASFEDEANAHLIAAAPGLYEALKSAISCMSGYEELQGWVEQYKQAITKAQGK